MAEEKTDIVGKDLLEQLMFSLYPDAETIYREYLQNACDSINEAAEEGIIEKKDGHVSINIDKFHHTITIEDNGTGIKADEAEMTLKYIAHSKKKKESSAGFYGIGRLVGGGYCKQLSFLTSAQGENVASEMIFDMDQIREILEDDEDDSSASEVIHKVTTFRNDIPDEPQKHYFKVVLKDVLPDYYDVLLEEEKIYSYLMQVAPIPYDAIFFNNLIKPNLTKDDNKYLNYYNQLNAVKVSINNIVGIEKPYETKFKGTEHESISEDGEIIPENAPINEIRFFSIADPQLGDLAWGWYAYTPAGTQIKEIDPFTYKKVLTRGIRLRCHNIQVGDENVLNKYFKQARSHTYFNGEIFIINQNIKPTADRSDIAPTSVAKCFQTKLGEFFRNELEKLYQEANKANKQLENIRKADEEIRKIEDSTEIPAESKATKLAQQQEERQKAQEKLNKIISKSTDENQCDSMRILAENFKKQWDDYTKNPAVTSVTQTTTVQQTSSAPKSIDEKIAELSVKYNECEISLLRKIFNIMDSRYLKKYTQIVKSIKESILNDLKK